MRADDLTNIADVLASDTDDGEVRLHIGDTTDPEGGIDNDVVPWGPDGFIARPNDPDNDGAAQVLYLVDGQEKRALGTSDKRWATHASDLEPGDRAIVSACPTRLVLKRAATTITLYTETSDGKPIRLDINGHDGSVTISVEGSGSSSSLVMKPDALTLSVDGGGSLVIDKNGVHVNGPLLDVNTPRGNLGTIAGQPPPPGANSLLFGVAGMAGAPSPNWTIAT
jgi:hypothetical protein